MVASRSNNRHSEKELSDPVFLYWQSIEYYQPLTREQEVALVRQAREGDEEALNNLVTANLRFVVSVAKEYSGYGLSMIELISEGNLGLLEAARRFDENRGFKFITYAVWWIRQAMLKALAMQKKTIPPPVNQMNDLKKLEREAVGLTQELGRTPTAEEMASKAGISLSRTTRALQAGKSDISLNASLYPDEDKTLISELAGGETGLEEEFERHILAETVARCLEALNKRECRILRRYYGLDGQPPMTLEQIGEGMGLTRERIRQIRDHALDKLRARYGEVLVEFSRN
ncbi:MAG: RNA polymerase sigma factor RpoD/SigA [Candidatus Latescibacteria bacterium]|nr:RNA polymerase sigma factor RpoD/SigA [Candidatus Latescibacterota bacterium]